MKQEYSPQREHTEAQKYIGPLGFVQSQTEEIAAMFCLFLLGAANIFISFMISLVQVGSDTTARLPFLCSLSIRLKQGCIE